MVFIECKLREKMIEVNGKNINVVFKNNYENKPVIIFLHDSLGCVQLWRDFPEKLAEETQCNILVYDRIGYGKSDPMTTYERPVNYMELEADILHNLMNILKIEEAILFGHSDGGTIALLTASKYPNKIKAVICEAAHIFVEDVTLKGINEAKESYEHTNLSQRLEKYHGTKVDTLFKAWTETWTRSDFRDWNIESCLSDITCPLLFIQGELDEYGTMKQVEKTITQTNGFAEKYIISNTGHTPHKEQAELTLDASKKFILNKIYLN